MNGAFYFLSGLNKKKQEGGEEPRQWASQGAAGYKWDSAVLNSKSHKIKKKMGRVHTHTHTFKIQYQHSTFIFYFRKRNTFLAFLSRQARAVTSNKKIKLSHSDPHLPAGQQQISLWLWIFNNKHQNKLHNNRSCFLRHGVRHGEVKGAGVTISGWKGHPVRTWS